MRSVNLIHETVWVIFFWGLALVALAVIGLHIHWNINSVTIEKLRPAFRI